MSKHSWLRAATASVLVLGACHVERSAEVDGQTFVRCAMHRAPEARSFRAGALVATVRARTLEVSAARPLRIAAFTVQAGALRPEDLALLRSEKPDLIFYLGGLGDSEPAARDNLARVAALHLPTLFVPGGGDRAPLIEAAFSALEEQPWMVDARGLRELRIGDQRFVIAPGAPLGRYAVDAEACGLTSEDLREILEAAQQAPAERSYLLSWQAATSRGFGGAEAGSPALLTMARQLGIEHGLFAFPAPENEGSAWAVPGLGPLGTQRGDGARAHSGVGTWTLGSDGLKP